MIKMNYDKILKEQVQSMKEQGIKDEIITESLISNGEDFDEVYEIVYNNGE